MFLWVSTLFYGFGAGFLPYGSGSHVDFGIGSWGESFARFNVNMFGYFAYAYFPLLLLGVYRLYRHGGYSVRRVELLFGYFLLSFSVLVMQGLLLGVGSIGMGVATRLSALVGVLGIFLLSLFSMAVSFLVIFGNRAALIRASAVSYGNYALSILKMILTSAKNAFFGVIHRINRFRSSRLRVNFSKFRLPRLRPAARPPVDSIKPFCDTKVQVLQEDNMPQYTLSSDDRSAGVFVGRYEKNYLDLNAQHHENPPEPSCDIGNNSVHIMSREEQFRAVIAHRRSLLQKVPQSSFLMDRSLHSHGIVDRLSEPPQTSDSHHHRMFSGHAQDTFTPDSVSASNCIGVEQAIFVDSRPVNASLTHYAVPSSTEISSQECDSSLVSHAVDSVVSVAITDSNSVLNTPVNTEQHHEDLPVGTLEPDIADTPHCTSVIGRAYTSDLYVDSTHCSLEHTQPSPDNSRVSDLPTVSGVLDRDAMFSTQSDMRSLTLQSADVVWSVPSDPSVDNDYRLPPFDLLDIGSNSVQVDEQEIDFKIENLLNKLRVFKINGDIVRVYAGPVVTIFEFRPDPNVKVNKILSLQDDLAMTLKAKTIRIEAPIPGKDVMGIEIPNNRTDTIYLREILESHVFQSSSSSLTIALGKDIMGNAFVSNLEKLPHLLVAGTTGSGKSVGMNAMILSLLYRNSPQSLKLMMIDPKKVEFEVYEDIPHLITPIINNPERAVLALAAAANEMDRRYDKLASIRSKNIHSYNQKSADKMPFLVIVIDELADLVMTGGRDVEFSIARISQMGRAAGIHLIVATQRSSTDVVTGLIKTNLPSRISYKVGNRIDSKVILDQFGAERLLGNGDGLFTPPGGGLVRIHAPLVSENEIESVVKFIKSQCTATYDDDFLGEKKAGVSASDKFSEDDSLLEEARSVILQDNRTSISNLQRRLSIGYNKASLIIEALEEEGFLSAPNSKNERTILRN